MVSDRDYNLAHLDVEREKLEVMKQQLECLNAIGIAIQDMDIKLEVLLRHKGIDINDP